MSPFENGLGRELTEVGISGRLRRRILIEVADHLACDPDAVLGDPRTLARQFADELGSARARTAALASFAALALAGTLFGAAFALSPATAFGAAPAGAPQLGRLATIVAVLAPQIAFVAGGLAALRWLRRRRSGVLAAAEATVIVRRAAVGVGAGIATMASLGTLAISDQHYLPGAWMAFAVVASVIGLGALGAAVPSVLAAVAVRPVAAGPAGDLFDDLGRLVPPALQGRPWRLALAAAGVVAVIITLAGVAGSDGLDGAVRGIGDGLVCLLGFATLGRFLGLWAPGRRSRAG
jgi:hypothetical protein